MWPPGRQNLPDTLRTQRFSSLSKHRAIQMEKPIFLLHRTSTSCSFSVHSPNHTTHVRAYIRAICFVPPGLPLSFNRTDWLQESLLSGVQNVDAQKHFRTMLWVHYPAKGLRGGTRYATIRKVRFCSVPQMAPPLSPWGCYQLEHRTTLPEWRPPEM